MNERYPLVVIVGPTASGKSPLGIWLAERLNGEVLACDSAQVYRRFDIGTAKVPISERRGIAHHLVDLVEPGELFTAGDYRRRALEVLGELRLRGKLPIFTAGTGLYLRAVLEGLADAPTRSESLRARLKQAADTPQYLHRLLVRLDRDAAGRIAPNDTQKVTRALEIRLLARKPVADVQKGGQTSLEGFEIVKVGLMPSRSALYHRIEKRVDSMVEAGWLLEVQTLLTAGLSPTSKPFEFIGYRELLGHVSGKASLEDATTAVKQATRRYAKRQITWFRKEQRVAWFEGFGDKPATQTDILSHIQSKLSAAKSHTAAY